MSPYTSSKLIQRLSGVPIFISLAAVCSPAFALESGCSAPAASGESSSNQARQVVAIDPDTGELVSSPMPEDARLEQRDSGPVVTRELSDGTVVADVGDRFRAHLIAEVVDGELVTCHRTLGNHSESLEIKEEQDE